MGNLNDQEIKITADEIERLKFDYSKAIEMIQHYEKLFWQVGAILIAGLFIMMGIVSKEQVYVEAPQILIPVIAFTLLIDLFWFLWYTRNRIVVLNRFERLRDIEDIIPEICNYSYCLYDEENRFKTSIKDNFGFWLSGRMRHSLLLRCFCILFPIPLISIYTYATFQLSQTFTVSMIVILGLFCLPLLFIAVYPLESYTRSEPKQAAKSFQNE